MTSPNITVDQDQLQSAGGRWNTMSGDLNVGDAPHPGSDPTDPTVLATVTIHATHQMTTAQLQELLQSYASGTQHKASSFGAQDKGSASQMKDILNMLTSGGKDLMGIATNGAQVGAQMATTVGQAGTQIASTLGQTASQMASTASKNNAPGGSVAGGLTNPDNINHSNVTTNAEGKDDGRSHDHAESVSSR